MRIIVISIVIGLVCILWMLRKDEEQGIKKNYSLEKAVISEVTSSHKKGEPKVEYTYSFKGRLFKSEQVLSGLPFRSMYSVLAGRSFAVLIDSTEPSESHIMVTPNDFEAMGWKYPDSLKWVETFYQKDFKSTW